MIYILEYIWIDGNGQLRSKYKTASHDEYLHPPNWNYDGSSTNQASTHNSEVVLCPVARYNNPFFDSNKALLVLCDTYYDVNGELVPTQSNNRCTANNIFNSKTSIEYKPWYGLEQEYFIMTPNETHMSVTPLAFSGKMIPEKQGGYYCGVGYQHVNIRALAEKHYTYCLKAGLRVSGINAEVAPSQWEYQIGPVEGIEAADMLWISRYILHRLGEEYNVNISFKPKPIASPWNGSGLHTNFSTNETRDTKAGMNAIDRYVERLGCRHMEHLALYGDNSERLSGECETSDKNTFSCGRGNRGSSIRIPKQVIKDGCGYFEDRRPASDADPYLVTSMIYKTCCTDD